MACDGGSGDDVEASACRFPSTIILETFRKLERRTAGRGRTTEEEDSVICDTYYGKDCRLQISLDRHR